ncbi:MAG: L,D-transpeptidase [Polyangiaceae bacterium]
MADQRNSSSRAGTRASGARAERAARPKPTASPRASRLSFAPILAFLAAGGIASGVVYGMGCRSNESAGTERPLSVIGSASNQAAPGGTNADPSHASEKPNVSSNSSAASTPSSTSTTATPEEPAKEIPWDGPWLGATAMTTPIYPDTRFGEERVGYIRQGGKVPVKPNPIKKSNCKDGWYELVDGGYVCGKYATLDLDNPRVKLGVRQPDLNAIVPYQYAYNRFNGTPLYKSLPTRDEMNKYEPYLLEKKKKKEEEAKAAAAASASSSASAEPVADSERPKGKHAPPVEGSSDGNVPTADTPDAKAAVEAVSEPAAGDSSAPATGDEAPPPPPKPWWQDESKDGKKPNVTLADLDAEADGNLAKRMVKGFFVAVDKTFGWNDRLWYRTTGGLVAPTDRMWINKPPESKGLAWPEGAQAVFFALGDKAVRYEPTDDQKKMREKKGSQKVPRLGSVGLTGKTMEVSGTLYRETIDGGWVKASAGTITAPGARPSEVGEHERWVDVNLDAKTLVLFEGDKPMYAALISPGKRSRIKKKDHATPTGKFRIREKHVSVTMDGDGAAGDLPYSIEDVPYVAYFKGSYALHAAFWHQNFGREMSHGCVNLSPRDAKVVFDFVEPHLPRGWHGVFATKDHPGSLVVLHE